eukprot:PhM_4_TR1979/c0_g1_i2/m.43773
MLQRTTHCLGRQKSQVQHGIRHRLASSRWGRNYNYAMAMYGPYGYGIGKIQPRRDRSAPIVSITPDAKSTTSLTQSDVTRTLSPEWTPYALADGGVLFTHPSTKQVLQWTHDVMKHEREASGQSSRYDAERSAKIRDLLARNTIEAQPIEAWRKRHVVDVLRKNISRNTDLSKVK